MAWVGNDRELVEEARGFLVACLDSSPWRRFSPLFARERVRTLPGLVDAFAESGEAFAADLARAGGGVAGSKDLFEPLLLTPTLLAAYLYRLSHACFVRDVPDVPDAVSVLSRWMTGVEIYYSAEIGPGLKIIHGLGTVIGAGCRIGSHFTVYQGVTLGDKLAPQTGTGARPVIGDHVIASVGCSILGPVHVGDWSVIGAHAVVLDSLPSRCIATGAPAVVKVENLAEERLQAFRAAIKG